MPEDAKAAIAHLADRGKTSLKASAAVRSSAIFADTRKYVFPNRLPGDAKTKIANWRQRGRIAVILGFEENTRSSCANCQELGHVYIRFLGAGPFKYPPGGRTPCIWQDEGWFEIDQTIAWLCPACQGEPYLEDLLPEEREEWVHR